MERGNLKTLLGALQLVALDELDLAVLRAASLGNPRQKVEHFQFVLALFRELKQHAEENHVRVRLFARF